mmetsp:Transcript_34584/g.33792  ORF Transcript_34584/g.33792 Transcript_34584/m.33792 type:complete len:80 (+) Transcript_34584:590-829(+)
MMFDTCGVTIRNEERFVQLGTGWLLRELSQNDHKKTSAFIKKNIKYFSSEGLSYAIEKMDKEDKTSFKELRKKTLNKQS